MMTMRLSLKPYSSAALNVGGVILIGMGLYFIFLRPPLLPEDPRYMGTSIEQIRIAIPGLLLWLRQVFHAMGGYMCATGLLTCYIASTSFRKREAGVEWIVAVTGMVSIGLMVMVNFVLNSDFKWTLLLFTFPWVLSLGLYIREKRVSANRDELYS